MENLNAYIFNILKDKWDSVPYTVLVIEDTIIDSGTWMSLIDERVEGILYGLSLANYEIKKHKNKIISPELKQDFSAIKLMDYVNKQT